MQDPAEIRTTWVPVNIFLLSASPTVHLLFGGEVNPELIPSGKTYLNRSQCTKGCFLEPGV